MLLISGIGHFRFRFEGPGAFQNWPIWAKLLKLFINESQENELKAAEQTGKQILSLPTVSGKPVVILSAREKSNSDRARYFNEKKADLARLYPGARQMWVDSGHVIHKDKPEVVIEAIRSVAMQPD
jgi:hypothetical protein